MRLGADVIEKSPDAAVVCFGLNDINNALDGYTSALGEIFDRLQAADIEVIFMTPNMLNTYVDDSLTGGLREYAHKTAPIPDGRPDGCVYGSGRADGASTRRGGVRLLQRVEAAL